MKIKEPTLTEQNTATHQEECLPDGQKTTNKLSEEAIPDPQVKAGQKAPRRQFSTAYKLKILEEYDACTNPLARGALIRREGLYHSVLSNWRKQRDAGKLDNRTKRKASKAVQTNQQLSRENAQLKKKLAQAEAIIALQKKVSDLLGTHILPAENSETV